MLRRRPDKDVNVTHDISSCSNSDIRDNSTAVVLCRQEYGEAVNHSSLLVSLQGELKPCHRLDLVDPRTSLASLFPYNILIFTFYILLHTACVLVSDG